MPRYEALLSVEVVHAYFHDPRRLRLRFRPDRDTDAWLARAGCVVRPGPNALQIFHDAETSAGVFAAPDVSPAELRFAAIADDPQFADFTADLPARMAPPPCFLGDATARADGAFPMAPAPLAWSRSGLGPASLDDTPPPLDADGKPTRPPLEAEPPPLGRWTGGGPRPHLVLRLPLPTAPKDAGRAYRLELASRSTTWKYILTGDWTDLEPQIVDTAAAFEFKAPAQEPLADGRTGLAIRSLTPIPLRERPDQRFQLRAGAAGAVLMDYLPGARPGVATLDPPASPPAPLVSEIYVARLLEPLRRSPSRS